MPAASTAALGGLEVGHVELERVAVDLAGDPLRALGVDVADPDLGALGGQPRGDRGADPAGAAGHQSLSSLQPHRARGSIDWRARGRAAHHPDHRRHRRPRRRPGAALGPGRGADRDRLALGRARRGGGGEAAREGPRRRGRGPAQRGRRAARRDRLPHRPLPRPVGEPQQPARGAAAGPDPGRLHGAARRRRQRQGDPLARRLAGLGRPAGAGDGPRGRHRRRRPAHGRRPDPRRRRGRARRGRPRLRRPQGRQGAGGAADRADPRPARGQRRRRWRWRGSSSS